MNQHSNYWSQILTQLLPFEHMPSGVPPEGLSIGISSSRMDVQLQLFQAEDLVASAVDTSIRAWPADKEPWSRLPEVGIYFLRLRSEVSLEFVSHLIGGLDYDGRQMFKGSEDIAPVDFARYLMTDWWLSAGRAIAADKLILERHDSDARSRYPKE